MVMGGDSCAKCHGFEIRHHILDGHFFTLICCKNCIVCLKRPKINEKRGRGWPILKNKKRELPCDFKHPIRVLYCSVAGFQLMTSEQQKY